MSSAALQTLAAKSRPSSDSSHTGLLLRRKCACGSPNSSLTGKCPECKSRKPLQAKHRSGQLQRQEAPKEKTAQEKYLEGLEKLGEAFLKTPLGKELLEKMKQDALVKGATALGKVFIATWPGKIVTGAAATGAVAALAATHKELPAQIPEIPLDIITPGLSVQLTYKGPVDKPTEAMITFKFTEQAAKASGDQKPLSASEKYRAETARLAAENEKFRAGMTYPPGSPEYLQQKAEQEAIRKAALKYSGGPYIEGTFKKYPWLATPQPKSGLQLTLPRPSFGIQPPSLLGDEFKLKLPTEQKKKEDEPALQKKLSVGASHDPLEQEADRVADQVLASPAPTAVSGAPLRIQRFSGPTSEETGPAPVSVDRVLASSGRPLEPALRKDMEHRFGHDFSAVRVYSGEAAEQSALDVSAHAYTVGNNIVFGASSYEPGTQSGRRLIAHELAHVVQQSSTDKGSFGQGDEKLSLSSMPRIQYQPAVMPYPPMLARSPKPQTGWWNGKAALIRAAIREAKNFTTYPDGAFWIINPLNDADRATIMTYLDRGDLEQLMAHTTEAAGSVPNAKDIAAKAARALDAAQPKPTSWWGQKVESIRFTITNSKNFTSYPDGTFWRINPLNDDDRAHIMTLLAREELESLFARGAEAISARIPHAVDIVAKATDELHRRGFVPRTGTAPTEPLPESEDTDYRKDPIYVDNIASAHFDVQTGEFWAVHINGVTFPLSLREVLTNSDHHNFPKQVQAGEPRHAMLQYFYRGPGGLIGPSLYSTALTPNIVDCARQVREALPGATAMRAIGLNLLEMQKTSLQAAIAGKAVAAVGGRIFARAWRARGIPGGNGSDSSSTLPKEKTAVAPSIKPMPTVRPRATLQQLREMISNSGDYYTTRTNADVAQNQTVVAKQSTDPMAPPGVYLVRGVKGAPYGDYAISIEGAKYRGIRGVKGRAEEFVLDGEIPANEGVWFTAEDYAAAKASTKTQ